MKKSQRRGKDLVVVLPVNWHHSQKVYMPPLSLTNVLRMTSAQPKNLNVQSFPRPPLLEKTPRHLQIRWNGELIADTRDAYWVLETHHPPSAYPHAWLPVPSPCSPILSTCCGWLILFLRAFNMLSWCTAYYLPPSAVKIPLTKTGRRTWCEWKGAATYWAASEPTAGATNGKKTLITDRIWSYERPTPRFEPIKDHLSFYAGPWDCFVDGEKVEPQPGDFYGGWVTSDIGGIVKGRNGNWDPVV